MSNYDSYLDDSLQYLNQYIINMKSRPILFIGSGFSQRYINSPTWLELLTRLVKDNSEIEMPIKYFIQEYNGDYPKIASKLVDYYHTYAWKNYDNIEKFPPFLFESNSRSIHLKYKIAEILIDLMKQFDIETHGLQEEIRLLKSLNPQAFITTNYDCLLETLFPKYETIIGQQIIRQKKSTNIGHILKIHGSTENCESIIIEQTDYDNFFQKQIYLVAKLLTYFMEHPIIFIGYSLNDENIKSILYNIKQIVNTEVEAFIDNIWFIEWSKDPITLDEIPSREKSISVGKGESVRVNYIKVHTYEKLYEALYQDSVDIEFLKQIEETVYNVVKSDTITNLEVDIASLRYLTDRDELLNSFTKNSLDKSSAPTSMITFAHISDPNQLASQFTLTATELCKKVYDGKKSYWSHAYDLINIIEKEKGVNLRRSNNTYHINMKGISRFSLRMVELLKLVKDNQPYDLELEETDISCSSPVI